MHASSAIKKTGLFLLVFCSFAKAQTVNIPDENFKKFLLETGVDANANGQIETNEAKNSTKLYLRVLINDFTGLEAFTALQELTCWGARGTKINLSSNKALTHLNVHIGKLTELNLGNNIALQYLDCSNNDLENLDLSNNKALTWLDCSSNKLKQLDLSNNTALAYINCHFNDLATLNLTGIKNLDYLECGYNDLTALDLSGNIKLTHLECLVNDFNQLNLANAVALVYLDCSNLKMTQLNLSNNAKLKWLNCEENELTALDLSTNKALRWLNCSKNKLTNLSLASNTALGYLTVNENQLTTLNTSNNAQLLKIHGRQNNITGLDITNNTKLDLLDCSLNKLTTLDISASKSLQHFYAVDNPATFNLITNEVQKSRIMSKNKNWITDLSPSWIESKGSEEVVLPYRKGFISKTYRDTTYSTKIITAKCIYSCNDRYFSRTVTKINYYLSFANDSLTLYKLEYNYGIVVINENRPDDTVPHLDSLLHYYDTLGWILKKETLALRDISLKKSKLKPFKAPEWSSQPNTWCINVERKESVYGRAELVYDYDPDYIQRFGTGNLNFYLATKEEAKQLANEIKAAVKSAKAKKP